MIKTKMIKELEKLLNDVEFFEEEYYFDISGIDDCGNIILSILDAETNELILDLQVQYIEDMDTLMTLFIRQLYCDYINPLRKETKGWITFTKRKIESLSKWSMRNREDKMLKINEELIERYKKLERAKYQIDFYKDFVNIFYRVRETFLTEVA
ncbi:hypothetical protein [Clostridium butyricum]|uniref:hypothetical protein n=1 Tax=Clostridium butyricum TaxID=1492 RepID=UPI0003F4EE2F|nr:hypothetical protein [Clostridium butyricum]